MIRGIVLAAGSSRRMGTAKALLPLDGESFVGRVIRALRDGGCDGVSVVVGDPIQPDVNAIVRVVRAWDAEPLPNPAADAEQIDSLRVALRTLGDDAEAVVVCPVDVPGIQPATVRALIAAFRRSSPPLVVPTHGGKHGHPVLFARPLFPELLADPLPEGARTVVHAHASAAAEVPTDDAAILRDVDTPADYRKIQGNGDP